MGSTQRLGGDKTQPVSGLQRGIRSDERIEHHDVSPPDEVPTARTRLRVHAEIAAGYRNRSRGNRRPRRRPSLDAAQGVRETLDVRETGREAEECDS